MLRLSPRPFAYGGLAVLAILASCIGIATFTASVVAARAFIPGLPVDDPDRVVQLALTRERSPGTFEPLARSQLVAIASRIGAAGSVGGVRSAAVHVTSTGTNAVRARAGVVHGDVFRTLGVAPRLGRTLRRDDEAPGAEPVVLLGHALWQDLFGGDPEVLGGEVRVSGRRAVIVGVMPPGFRFPAREQLWIPTPSESSAALNGIARLSAGRSLATLRAELSGLSDGLHDGGSADLGPDGILSARDWVDMRRDGNLEAEAMPAVVGASLLILIVACSNVGLLFLVRALRSERSTATRMALGASRARIATERVLETFLLTGIGGLLGLVLITGWVHNLRARSEGLLEYGVEFAVDPTVLLATCAGIVLGALVAGLLPALRGTDLDLARTLQQGPGSGGSLRLGRASALLLVLQVAFTSMALVGIGHSVRGLRGTLGSALEGPSLPIERTLVARYELLATRHPERPARAEIYRRIAEELAAAPEVEEVATGDVLPGVIWGFGARARRVQLEGDGSGAGATVTTYAAAVSPGYFSLLDGGLLRGRMQGWGDRPTGEPVAVVNESFARRWFSDREVTGSRISVGGRGWHRVVGVVSDVAMERPDGRSDAVYLPLSHPSAPIWLVVVAHEAPLAVAPLVREVIARHDPDAPVWNVALFGELIREFSATARLLMNSFVLFALSALLLTAIGLHGLLGFVVHQRTREVAVRAALGADLGTLGWDLFGRLGGGLTLGLGVGIGLAWWLSPLLAFGLLGSDPRDPTLYIVIPAVILITFVLAGLSPIHRVKRMEITEALRTDA